MLTSDNLDYICFINIEIYQCKQFSSYYNNILDFCSRMWYLSGFVSPEFRTFQFSTASLFRATIISTSHNFNNPQLNGLSLHLECCCRWIESNLTWLNFILLDCIDYIYKRNNDIKVSASAQTICWSAVNAHNWNTTGQTT